MMERTRAPARRCQLNGEGPVEEKKDVNAEPMRGMREVESGAMKTDWVPSFALGSRVKATRGVGRRFWNVL